LIVAGLLTAIFAIDSSTGDSPFQHLYYLPIIFAGVFLPRDAGALVGGIAVVLYHVANPVLLSSGYRESDIVQIALFVAIGVVTGTLAEDRRRLHQLSETDDLTGLYNIRGFEARLTPAIRAASHAGLMMTLLVLDVDRLKSINDVHGHRAGADAVRIVGRLIEATLPAGSFACRFGGDEFVAALPGRDPTAAATAAERLRHAVADAAPTLGGTPFPAGTLSVSIGVASRALPGAAGTDPDDDEAAEIGESLFRAADRALYDAKASGRNQIRTAEYAIDCVDS
jgi:diguanylate cyclase (GGDEF)-like protein